MANKNEIVISIDEYKELLLKDKPNNTDTMLLDRIKTLLYDHIQYEKDWNNNVKIDFKYDSKFCDEKAKKDAEKVKMEKARAIKDLDEE